MAGELIVQLNPRDLYRETPLGYFASTFERPRGVAACASLQKLLGSQLKESYTVQAIVPAIAALATGITIRLALVDDGTNPSDLGTNVRIGATAQNLSAAGALIDFSNSAGAEQLATVTLSATAGNPVIATIAIANAQLASLAAGNILSLRIRRAGEDVLDTCPGNVLIVGGCITNT